MKIILASASKTREKILRELGFDVLIKKPNIDENINFTNPYFAVVKLAREKIKSVSGNFSLIPTVGVDTVVLVKDKVLQKPKDKYQAIQMLKEIFSNPHIVLSGFCILKDKDMIEDIEETAVELNKVPDEFLKEIVEKEGIFFDTAGGLMLEKFKFLIKKIKGCYFNLFGMPICKILRLLIKPKPVV